MNQVIIKKPSGAPFQLKLEKDIEDNVFFRLYAPLTPELQKLTIRVKDGLRFNLKTIIKSQIKWKKA